MKLREYGADNKELTANLPTSILCTNNPKGKVRYMRTSKYMSNMLTVQTVDSHMGRVSVCMMRSGYKVNS